MARHSLDQAIPTVALLALVVGFVAPRTTPGVLALLALPPAILAAARNRLLAGFRFEGLLLVAAVFGLYLVLSATWSADRGEAIGAIALYALFAAGIAAAAAAMPALDDDLLARIRRAVLVALAVGVAYLAVEAAFSQPLRRWVATAIPALRPSAKHAVVEGGNVVGLGHYLLNRNLALLGLALWPALYFARDLLPRRVATLVVSGALLLLAALAVFNSEHETSQLALVASCLAFASAICLPRLTRGLVLVAWVVATLAVVPIASAGYGAKLYQADWLPWTARNRVVLWGVHADKVRDAPLLGVGIKSTKALDDLAADTAPRPADHPYPLRTGRHAHNIYLQTWYELGAVGALFLLAIGLLVLRAFARAPAGAQPYLYASFVALAVTGAFSWGMWQPWFMAAFGIWAVLALLMCETARRRAAD